MQYKGYFKKSRSLILIISKDIGEYFFYNLYDGRFKKFSGLNSDTQSTVYSFILN